MGSPVNGFGQPAIPHPRHSLRPLRVLLFISTNPIRTIDIPPTNVVDHHHIFNRAVYELGVGIRAGYGMDTVLSITLAAE